jgi:hypothetical protein
MITDDEVKAELHVMGIDDDEQIPSDDEGDGFDEDYKAFMQEMSEEQQLN